MIRSAVSSKLVHIAFMQKILSLEKSSFEVSPIFIATVSSCDLKRCMTYDLDLHRVKVNRLAKYLGQGSFSFESWCPDTHTHTHNHRLLHVATKVIDNECRVYTSAEVVRVLVHYHVFWHQYWPTCTRARLLVGWAHLRSRLNSYSDREEHYERSRWTLWYGASLNGVCRTTLFCRSNWPRKWRASDRRACWHTESTTLSWHCPPSRPTCLYEPCSVRCWRDEAYSAVCDGSGTAVWEEVDDDKLGACDGEGIGLDPWPDLTRPELLIRFQL